MILRFIHCNGRSLLFIFVYLHIFKGIYYNRYRRNGWTWIIGRTIYVLIIIIAFLGYVLPWGQIRYWGATVIRRLITTVPAIGKWLLIIIWGDYRVNNRTLNRFYRLHFLLPVVVIIIIIIHLLALHYKGSTTLNSRRLVIVPFRNYFLVKDVVGFIVASLMLIINIIYFPRYFLDSENSIPARPLITPIHIVPEWYFLFAYCILKRFESKTVGVIILVISVVIFPALSLKNKQNNHLSHKITMILWRVNFCILTKIGAMELNYPFVWLRSVCTIIHFVPIIT